MHAQAHAHAHALCIIWMACKYTFTCILHHLESWMRMHEHIAEDMHMRMHLTCTLCITCDMDGMPMPMPMHMHSITLGILDAHAPALADLFQCHNIISKSLEMRSFQTNSSPPSGPLAAGLRGSNQDFTLSYGFAALFGIRSL